jgi:hypothetical protein
MLNQHEHENGGSMIQPESNTTVPEGTPYGEFLAELEEIQRLKWLASERGGRDVGFEHALNEWAANHRESWRRDRNLRQVRPR